ncbi:NAD(P)/FAD-dependent oxidoreductase [Terribacillus sp. DMT04]|uniref:NAD(P)/FAD-dependent oxidoreductase n=1 Tax=Terribacillus sp. DMT04 TaxID=2850441 RepID=UPI001C2C4115|nr:NAD(P)/FAD-dependent oxidoreductase [Terribacillus sp. DMT04]QXE02107.1 NAD(P)/FAD-dependent oxidoreductase [Terribacillus sp. DMT04]
MRNDFIYDVIIIGGGTTGLYASFYTNLRKMTTLLIEATAEFGGKVAQFYPEKHIYDVGAYPAATGEEMVAQLLEQSRKAKPEIVTGEFVEHIKKRSDGIFELMTTQGTLYMTRTVILTCGMGTYQMKPLPLEEASLYEGKNLHYYLKSSENFRNQRVVVYAANRTGIDWAMALEKTAKEVTLLNQRDYFLYTPPQVMEALAETSIKVKYNHNVTKLLGNKQGLHTLLVEKDGIETMLQVDALLYYENVNLTQTPFDNWGIETDKHKVIVDYEMATSIPGIYAAGDAVHYPKKNMLIATGFAETITAVNSAKQYLDPSASAQVYSTIEYQKNRGR